MIWERNSGLQRIGPRLVLLAEKDPSQAWDGSSCRWQVPCGRGADVDADVDADVVSETEARRCVRQ